MKTRNRLGSLFVLLSVALNVAFVGAWIFHVLSAECDIRRSPAPDHGWSSLHERLDITASQRERLEPLLAGFLEESQACREELNRLRLELVDLLASPDPTPQAIGEAQKRIREGQRRMQSLVVGHLLHEKEILTPEQQEELFRLLREQCRCAGLGRLLGPTNRDAGHATGER